MVADTTYTTCSDEWATWVQIDCTSTTASTTGTWGYWCSNGTSTATTNCATSTTWATWSAAANHVIRYRQSQQAPPKQLTPEEQVEIAAKREAEAIALKAKREKEEADRKAASERAERLLAAQLTDEQKASYLKDRTFIVTAADGTKFRIKLGRAGNVEELNDAGKPIARLCIHPTEFVPDGDTVLAQKLMLETDPKAFRKIANRTEIRLAA